MTTRPIRVLCVDDNQLIAEALGRRLGREGDFVFVGSSSTADGLTERIEALRPDLVLLDINMPGKPAAVALAEAAALYPSVAIVALSGSFREADINEMMEAGARGYLSKDDEPTAMIDSLRRAAAGEYVFGEEVLRFMAAARPSGAAAVRENEGVADGRAR